MPTDTNTPKHNGEENPLISLLNKSKREFEGLTLMRLIRRDFDLVTELRETGVGWKDIVEALNFQGMEARARYAYFYEKRRRAKKEKEEGSGKKTNVPFMRQTKENARLGPPRPIGRGRLDLGQSSPDEEL